MMSILLHGCITNSTKTLIECDCRELHKNLQALLYKSWKQHPNNCSFRPLNSYLMNLIFWRTRHMGRCSWRKDEFMSDFHLLTPTYGRTSFDRSARTYLHRQCTGIGCSLLDLPGAIKDYERWRADIYIYIYIYIYWYYSVQLNQSWE